MRCVALAFLCAVGITAADRSKSIGPDAVWSDGERVMPEIVKACDSAPKFPACFAEQMARKAPAPAVAFTRALHNEVWMRGFRKTGQVDVAYVVYPFRANENPGWLFVNGSPASFDPDDFRRLEGALKNDPAWARVTAQYPKAQLFPGDRAGTVGPVAIEYPDGSQEFMADYRVMDGCHACDVLGNAFFTFEFNAKGKFTQLRFAGFDKELVWPVQTRAGQRFALVLGCDAGPACDWAEDQAPADSVLHATGKRADPQGGVVSLGYQATGSGTTQTTLRSQGGATLVLKVTAAPGLRR
jgi:hypothetical protein